MRRALRIGTLVSLAAAAVSAAFSCDLQVPNEFCNGVTLVGGEEAGAAQPSCSECMERSCCDQFGPCQASDDCVQSVRRARACLFDTQTAVGSNAEACGAEVADSSTPDAGVNAYDCMRERCLESCGPPPRCTLDPAVLLFGSATCDKCAAEGCCEGINACYRNRSCKLVLECIINDCKGELGPALAALGAQEAAEVQAERDQACTPDAAPAPGGVIPKCIGRCLSTFATENDPTNPATCLAFDVYACIARKPCGSECTFDGGGAPSDAAVDAPDAD